MDAMKQATVTAEDSSEGPATKRMRQQVCDYLLAALLGLYSGYI